MVLGYMHPAPDPDGTFQITSADALADDGGGDGLEGEAAGAPGQADVADGDGPALLPLDDLHAVGQAEGPHLGVALEGGAHARASRGGEADGNCVLHPAGVGGDVAHRLPHAYGRGSDDRAHPDGGHFS